MHRKHCGHTTKVYNENKQNKMSKCPPNKYCKQINKCWFETKPIKLNSFKLKFSYYVLRNIHKIDAKKFISFRYILSFSATRIFCVSSKNSTSIKFSKNYKIYQTAPTTMESILHIYQTDYI